jgi:outer membrane protein
MRTVRLVALLAVSAQVAFGQSAPTSIGGTLTLDQAIAIARENNPTFLNVKNNLRTAEAQVHTAYGALLPSSNVSFRTAYNQGGTQYVQGVALPSTDSYNSFYNIGLSYNIGAAALYAPRAARANRRASEADINNQSELLRSAVTTQYIQALETAAQAAVNDTLVQSAEGQLELVNAKTKVGAGTIVDVRAAEVALGQAQVAALTAHNQAQVAKLQLFQTMGVPANLDVELTTDFPLSQPQFSLDSLIALAHQVNPDLQARRSRLVASQAQVKVAKSQYLPSLSLSTGYGAQAFGYTDAEALVVGAQQNAAASARSCMTTDSIRTGAGLPPLSKPCGSGVLSQDELTRIRASNKPFSFQKAPYGVSLSLSVPLFNNFQREANIEQEQVQRDNAANDLRARNLQINTDVTQAYLTLVAQARTVELQTQNAAKAAEDLSAAQERYKVGAATFLDVTVARGIYEKAQIDRVTAIYEYHKAYANLETAVGRPLR